MYILAASTLRGRGGYRLTFQIDSYGAAALEERVLAFSGDLQQVTTGSVVNTIATVLDALDIDVPVPLWDAAGRTPQPT